MPDISICISPAEAFKSDDDAGCSIAKLALANVKLSPTATASNLPFMVETSLTDERTVAQLPSERNPVEAHEAPTRRSTDDCTCLTRTIPRMESNRGQRKPAHRW